MTTVSSSSPSLYAAKASGVATLNNLSIEDALQAVRLRSNVKVNIVDSVSNIKKYLGALTGIANNLGTITQDSSDTSTDALFALTADQYAKYHKVIAKLDAGSVSYNLALSGVTAAAAITYSANARIQTISVSDSSANIGSNIASLKGILDSNKLGTILQTGTATPIALTLASFEANSAVLDKIGTAYNVALSGANSAQAVGYIDNLRISSISIADTTGGVESNLDSLQRLGVRLKAITLNDTAVVSDDTTATNGKIDLTAEQVKRDAIVIGKVISSYQLAVHGASLAQSLALSKNKKVVTIDITDRGANIVKSLTMLNRLGGQLSSVTVTDSANPLSMTDVQLVTYDSLLGKFSGDYGINVAGSSALNATLLLAASGNYQGAAGAHINSIAIADTAAHISSYFAGLNDQAKLGNVTVLDQKNAIVLTAAQLADADSAGADSVLAKIAGGYSLRVTDVAAADAGDFADASSFNAHITAVSVTDDASAIQDHLEALASLGGKLESIVQTDRFATATRPAVEFQLDYATWIAHKATLEKVVGDYSVILDGVNSAAAGSVAADGHVSSFSVTDTGGEITKNFDVLANAGARLAAWAQTDTDTLTISADQFGAGAALLDKFNGSGGAAYALAVTGMSVGQLLEITPADHVVSASILDTGANITAHFDELQAKVASGLVSAITQQGTASTLSLTATQIADDADVLARLTGNYSLAVSGVAVTDAAALLAGNSHVSSMLVEGTNADVAANLGMLQDLGKTLRGIVISSGGSTFTISQADYAAYRATLDKIAGNYLVNLTGVGVDQVSALSGDTHVASMAIADTAEKISQKFDTLRKYLPKIARINGGAAADTGTGLSINAMQYASGAALLAKINYDGTTVNGVTTTMAKALAIGGSADGRVTALTVKDTSANIAENLDDLQANAKVTAVIQSGIVTPLSITRAQLTNDAGILAKLSGNYSLHVTGVAAATVGAVDGAKDLLAHNAKVAAVSVTATASEISANIADLARLGGKLAGLIQTDPASAINLTDASLVANRAVLDRIDGYRVNVSAVSVARALVLADDDRVASINISATGAEIAKYFDALKATLPKVVGINKPSSGAPPVTALTLGAEQYAQGGALLAKIGDYTATVKGVSAGYAQTLSSDDHVAALLVADSSANIARNLDDLKANVKVAGITVEDVNTPLNITETQRAADATTLGMIAGDWGMNVTGVAAENAATVDAAAHVANFSVATNAAGVANNLVALGGSPKLLSITLDNPGSLLSLTAASLLTTGNLAAVQKIDNGYSLAVSAATVANLTDLAEIDNVASIGIADSSANLSDKFDDLIDLGAQLMEVSLTAPSVPLALTYEQVVAGADVLAKIPGGSYMVDLFDVPADHVESLAASDKVDEIHVTDYSYNIAGHWENLVDKAQLTSITVLDNGVISLTGAQRALTGSDDLINKIQGAHTIEVSA